MASYYGQIECLDLLLKSGADVNMTNKNGLTPLMAAVADDQLKCVKLLIQAGADVKKRDNEDDTALSIAGQFAHYNC